MLTLFNDPELIKFYQDKSLWKGCFGGMTVIRHDILVALNNNYDLSKLLDVILCRYNRCSFERVIGCLLQKMYNTDTLFGDIFAYCKFGTPYSMKDQNKDLPIIKVWTGR